MATTARATCHSVFIATLAGAVVASAQGSSPSVRVAGCIQRSSVNIAGLKSPSGWVLAGASNTPLGGSAGAPSDQAIRPQPPPAESLPGPGLESTNAGISYLLDGQNLQVHAGEQVENEGTLVLDRSRGGGPGVPYLLRVRTIRTLARRCAPR